MKILGFVPIHYGAEYLELCLNSLSSICDKIYVSYTKNPSHGSAASVGNKIVQCPDGRDQIADICHSFLGQKLIWTEHNSFNRENEHRATVYKYNEWFDVTISADADEVFDIASLDPAVKMVRDGSVHRWGTCNYVNFWRSFDFICRDGFSPIRMFNNKYKDGERHGLIAKIYHFGTCQKKEIMEYKYLCHGHKNELRPNWLNDVYFKWTPDNQFGNLHCVANGLWNAEPFDKNSLPDYIKKHPNFNKYLV